jgi:REP element-mobilizing transposase RayT
MKVLAYHVIFCTHGFWLPNDPRGSGSTEVRYEPLRQFGPATTVTTRRSVAGRPHDRQLRQAAKEAMKYPEVFFTGHQALSVGLGFGEMAQKAGYRIHACAILPQHVHMVIARHHYPIEQVVRLLRQAATARLLADGRHPFADQRSPTGRLPSVWAQDFRKMFLFTPEDIQRCIRYVEDNPLKEGKRRQQWAFVIPYDG